jgi:hypothetical protein
MMTRCRIGGREVELNLEGKVRGEAVRASKPHGRSRTGVLCSGEQVSTPAPSPLSPYKNKLEKAFATWLDAQWRAGAIKGWHYEPFSFKLAEGKRYRVDFVSWGDEGVVCWETKGWHANIRDSLTHLKWAAQRFPFFKWRKAMRKKGTFEYQDIVV